MAHGDVRIERLESTVLRGNPMGDPTSRNLAIYLPPGYDPARRYPVLYGLVGYTGTGRMLLNIDPLSEDLQARLDRLILTKLCPPVIVALPDCFTRVGGSQYINSLALGRYEDYLLQEVLPFVETKHRCGRRGIWGKSSGGYGSIIQGMRHPEVFSALACHSGDMGFEYCYMGDFPKAMDSFQKAGGTAAWLKEFWAQPNRRRSEDFAALNTLGMAAHYSPEPSEELGIALPFDIQTGAFRDDVWQRWLRHDPVRIVAQHADALRQLAAVFIDCGSKDQFNLHWGARALHAALEVLRVPHIYEEFDDTHSNISYRYDRSIPLLANALDDSH